MPNSRRFSILLLTAMAAAVPALAAGTAPARGSDLRITVEEPHFICAKSGLEPSRVVFHPGSAPVLRGPPPCCDGQLACAQFLSTSTTVHARHRWHG